MEKLGILLIIIGIVELLWVPRLVYTKYNNLWVFWYNRYWFNVNSRRFIKLN